MGATVPLSAISFQGDGLKRPECVLAHASGLLFVPDWTESGGVTVIAPDGGRRRILCRDSRYVLRPNGIALEPGGSFLLAHLGTEMGGLFRLSTEGAVTPLLTAIGGRKLPPSNFILRQNEERIWLTVSTTKRPRSHAYRMDVADGFVVLVQGGEARVVADGLGYTNECLVSPDGRVLYVNETFARRTSAFDIRADGTLGPGHSVASYGKGCFPDGLAMDSQGALWVTSIVSNRVIRVGLDGAQEIMLEDNDPAHLDWVEQAFQTGSMGRPHLDTIKSQRLGNISNLAFGGGDLSTAYLGCLLADRIACFRSPVPGLAPPHWQHDLGPLASLADRRVTASQ